MAVAQIIGDRIRLFIDQTQKTAQLADAIGGSTPLFFRGNDLQVEVAFNLAGALMDLTNVDSVRMQVKTNAKPDSVSLMDATIDSGDLNLSLTLDQWNTGDPTQAQATFKFANGYTNLDMMGQNAITLYYVISLITSDSPPKLITVTPQNCTLTLVDSGFNTTAPSFVASPVYLTVQQSDARYGGSAALLALKMNISGGTFSGSVAFSGTSTMFTLPKLSTTQRTALSPTGGTFVYDTTIGGFFGYESAWKQFVTSVNSESGDVTLTTDDVDQGSTNKYMTNAGVLAQVLTAYSATSYVAITSSDTILTALEKLGGYANAATGSGTVTSVGLSLPTSTFTLGGTPVTTTGTLTATFVSQSAHFVLAGATSGGSATPSWRALVAGDIPSIAESQVTNLVTDLGNLLPLAGGIMTGPITLAKYAAGFSGIVSPAAAMIAYNTTSNLPSYYNGSAWIDLALSTSGGYLPLAGGTLTGPLNLAAGTPSGQNATSFAYTSVTYMPFSGGVFTGTISFSGGSSILTLPNLTTIQQNAIGSPTQGMMIYNTTTGNVTVWNGSFWSPFQGGTGGGSGGYLLTSGGTMTGNLYFANNTVGGLVLNSLTTTQMNTVTPATGMFIWNTTAVSPYFYSGSAWIALLSGSAYLPLTGGTMTGGVVLTGTGFAGITLNNMTGTQRDSLTGAAGNVVFNTSTNTLDYYNGSAWVSTSSAGSFMPLAGGTMLGDILFSGTSFAGLTLNSLTLVERNLLTAVAGNIIYNSSTASINFYNGSSWISLTTSSQSISVTSGNATGSISSSGIYTTPNDGIAHVYRVSFYIEITSTGSGTIQPQFTWTGLSATYTNKNIGSAFSGAATGPNQVSYFFAANPNTNMGLAVSVTSTFPAWDYVIILELIN